VVTLALALASTLAAAPSGSWKVEIVHKEDLRDKKKKGAPDATYNTAALLQESFTLAVKEPADPRPKAVELELVKGTLGKTSVSAGRGEAWVEMQTPPKDQRLRVGLTRYLDRLVMEDSLREAMSTCEPPSQPATQQWLHKTMAYITASQLDELAIKDFKVKCSKGKKGGVVHEVTYAVDAPRGRHGIEMKLKGKVVVDPAVWATTWNITGPMKVIFEKKSLAVPMSGQFTSIFVLSPK
jgi:hypothetical protein